MAMVLFDYVWGISACLGQEAGSEIHCRRKDIDPNRKIGGPNEWGAAFFEVREDFVGDIVPTGGADDGCLEVFSDEFVVCAECVRDGKVDADAVFRDGRVCRLYVFALSGAFYSFIGQDFFYHPAHSSVSAYKNFHTIFQLYYTKINFFGQYPLRARRCFCQDSDRDFLSP